MLPPNTLIRWPLGPPVLEIPSNVSGRRLSFPPRPCPRVSISGTREEWGVQEAARLQVTTRGQFTNQRQESSTSWVPPRPKPSATTSLSALAANTLGQDSKGALVTLTTANSSLRSKTRVWTIRLIFYLLEYWELLFVCVSQSLR